MSQRTLVRVYGDSVSLPRVTAGVTYDLSYPEIMRARLAAAPAPIECALYNRSINNIAVGDLYQRFVIDSSYFGKADDVLIIQSGIVDCAPRPIPHWLREQIGRLPGHARAPIIKVLHDHRARFLTLGRTWRRTPPGAFGATMRRWVAEAAGMCRHVYVINVLPTHAAIERHSPGFNASVNLFNGLIGDAVASAAAANVTLVDAHARVLAEPDGLARYVNAQDGHHLTAEGHALYGELLTAAGPLKVM